MCVRSVPGASFRFTGCFRGTRLRLRKIRTAGKISFLVLSVLLFWASQATAQSAPPNPPAQAAGNSTQSPSQNQTLPTPESAPQGPEADPTPLAPETAPAFVLPVLKTPPAAPFTRVPLPAARTPALEARVGYATLARVSGPNNQILLRGISSSVTKQYSEGFGGTLEVSYLRASNVFGTGESNSVFTYLIGPVFYPYRRNSFVTSLHALGGGARVSGVVVLLPNNTGYIKGALDDKAWALGGGLEKWFFSDSLALRVDIDALHTSFYNNSVKVHGEYDLRAIWGVIYYFGGRTKLTKERNLAGRQIE